MREGGGVLRAPNGLGSVDTDLLSHLPQLSGPSVGSQRLGSCEDTGEPRVLDVAGSPLG